MRRRHGTPFRGVLNPIPQQLTLVSLTYSVLTHGDGWQNSGLGLIPTLTSAKVGTKAWWLAH